VGIGTTSPIAPFHVKGVGQGWHLAIETNASGEGDLTWFQGGNAAGNQRAVLQVNATSGDFEGWTFDNTNWNKWLQVNRLNNNVGIGTSTPTSKLHIVSNNNTAGANTMSLQAPNVGPQMSHIHWGSTGDWYIRSSTTTGKIIIQDTGGNVGVGTTTPGYKLDVNGSINATSILINGSPFAGGGSQWATSGTTINFPAGNVGIGNASPGYKLDVSGAINATSFLINGSPFTQQWTTAGSAINFSTGNVGIGTSSPISKLTLGATTGTMTSTSGLTLGSDQKSIEFLHSPSGAGYGAKLYGVDQGNGLTSFRLAVRGSSATWTDALFVRAADNGAGGGNLGYIGIGTSTPDERLTVNGKIHSKEVKVDLTITGPDYVFEKEYSLPSLESVKTYINQNKHLPEVPSAKDMEANGINLSEMNMLLLKKIEELTLYVIELKKENELQNKNQIDQQKQIEELIKKNK
jgi:hypothetical protein